MKINNQNEEIQDENISQNDIRTIHKNMNKNVFKIKVNDEINIIVFLCVIHFLMF